MPNDSFQFKQFKISQDRCAMKVTTDGCLFGAWVASRLELLSEEKISEGILDIGAGTALLSLMIAQKIPGDITGVEIDAGAFIQAKENIAASPWSDRVSVVHTDALTWNPQRKWSVIVSNPPFYEAELSSPDRGRAVAHHGEGLRVEELLFIIKELLVVGGKFYLLMPWKRAEHVASMMERAGMHVSCRATMRASATHKPMRVMIEAGMVPVVTEEIMLTLRDENGEYSVECAELLAPYYLKLGLAL